MKRLLLGTAVAGVVVIAVVAALVAGGDSDSARTTQDSAPNGAERIVLSGSLGRSYSTLQGLTKAAELVVVGSVVDSTTTAEKISPDRDLVTFLTVHDFRVDETLKGETPESTIRVIQRGGRIDNMIREFEDDPLFEKGTRYILFLKYDGDIGVFSTVGVYQGRFILEEDRVSSLSVAYPDRPIDDIRTEDMAFSAFRAAVSD
jgi:hypothetical protein